MPSTDRLGEGLALAWFGGRLATGLLDVTSDLAALDDAGFWAVVLDFEGDVVCARFGDVREADLPRAPWPGVPPGSWTSSMSREDYLAGAAQIREGIAAGDYYQVNLCRVLSAALPAGADLLGLAGLLAVGNPAPYAGVLRVPSHDVMLATASPELFLGRDGDLVESRPIKGTAPTALRLTEKDRAENVMIVDLVRNDLGAVAVPGSVHVPVLCAVEEHPGLAHLVSTVRATLRAGAGWPELVGATFPPGSVTGAPKSSALQALVDLEPVPRGPYCGAVGWVDADRRRAELAVGIRTFWTRDDQLHLGTGAAVTWGSDPAGEWDETELKARRLRSVAEEVA